MTSYRCKVYHRDGWGGGGVPRTSQYSSHTPRPWSRAVQVADAVHIYYCIATRSVDEVIWGLVQKKLAVTSSTVSGTREAQLLSSGGGHYGAGRHGGSALGLGGEVDAGSSSAAPMPDIRAFMKQLACGACDGQPGPPRT
jgi:hypothetical protein